MSIQPGRVVARVIDEVASGLRPASSVDRFEVAVFSEPTDGGVFEFVRVAIRPSPPFATLLHFWTHALAGFLERRGEADQLAGVAGYAMCDAIGPELWCSSFRSQVDRLSEPARRDSALAGLDAGAEGHPPDAVRESYRMIDGSCRKSQVAATSREWLAWFWAHGHRADPQRVLVTHF